MNWFRENRWLGTFLIVVGISLILSLYFLFQAKSGFEEAAARFTEATAERNRLEHLNPFPNEANFRQMKTHLEEYGAGLGKLKEELKTQVLPSASLAPNEFQSRLRQAEVGIADRARANRVKLPDNFHLGFDEFTAALPNTAVAPLLGQQLAQVELLVGILIDARVDSIGALKRAPLALETATAPAALPGRNLPNQPGGGGPKMLDRAVVDLTFTASSSAMRKVVNQIASSGQQFYVVRTLHVKSEQAKGPARETTGSTAAPTAGLAPDKAAAAQKGPPPGAIKFIVGNEHIETSARIELVRFTF